MYDPRAYPEAVYPRSGPIRTPASLSSIPSGRVVYPSAYVIHMGQQGLFAPVAMPEPTFPGAHIVQMPPPLLSPSPFWARTDQGVPGAHIPGTPPQDGAQGQAKKPTWDEWVNSLIVYVNGAIQIAALTAGAAAGLGAPIPVGFASGIVFAVLAGGRVSLYAVETMEGIVEKVHKIKVPETGVFPDHIKHLEDVSDIINVIVKGFIQTGALLNATVAHYLLSANWVATKVTAPILTACTTAEVGILASEIVLNTMEARKDDFRAPPIAQKAMNIARGVIQIVALSSLAAAAWVAPFLIVRVVGYIRAGLASARTVSLMFEIAMDILHEYKAYEKKRQEQDQADPFELPPGFV